MGEEGIEGVGVGKGGGAHGGDPPPQDGANNPSRFPCPATFLGRRLILSDDSFLNVYLLVDSSKSVNKESFQIFKEWVENIVDRVSPG